MTLIVLNILAVILGSVQNLVALNQYWLSVFTIFSVVLFTIEYGLRLWSCVEHPSGNYSSPLAGRVKYAFTPLMLLDGLAIVPFVVGMSAMIDLRILRLFRLLELLRLTHYSDALQILVTLIKRERKTFAAIFVVIINLLLLVSYFIYLIERDVQPDVFSSIPHAMWWAIATLTTVGYGDVVPITHLGKVFGMLVMLIGIGMFAIPTGLLVTAFSEEMKRKDFVATWKLVANVPLFSSLNALEIASISELLRLRGVMPGETIIRKGELAERMFFIVSGEVEIKLPNEIINMRDGEFFGELGVLYKIRRTASVTALTFVELLQLEKKDLEALLETNPDLRERITMLASERHAQNLNSQKSVL
ncbi:MAG: cyclic nucleotide-gated ion channel/potassium channel family protein [Gammaproteobacteria bacterium]|nr:cyclic nucleotide-gated ion channel/potassium channel family protein [Gammaproteobacteria bacterium]